MALEEELVSWQQTGCCVSDIGLQLSRKSTDFCFIPVGSGMAG